MGKKGNQENTIHWVCTKCGYSSPITEKKCVNPSCQADLSTYGQKVGDRNSIGKEKKSSKGLVAGIMIGLLIGAVGVYFGMGSLNKSSQQEEVKNSVEDATSNTAVVEEEVTEVSDTEEVTEQTPSEEEEKWIYNVLMEDSKGWGSKDERPFAKVLGSEILRLDILSVTILDTLADAPADSWDVSQYQNRRVLAWTEENGEKYDLYIAGEGGINAKNCASLFAGYSNAEYINLNGNFHTDYAEDMRCLFDNCHSVKELDVSDLNTECATSIYGMFAECKSLTSLDVSHFDTSNVTNMYAMFYKCEGLESLDVSGFDTANVTDMKYMFSYCTSLKTLDVSGFDTSEVTDMYAMFYGCKNLEALDVSGFDTGKVTNMELMFYDCSGIDKADVANFDMRNVETAKNMFR